MKKLLLLAALVCAVPVSTFAMDSHMMEQREINSRRPGMNRMGQMDGMDRMEEMMGMCLANADKIGLSDEQAKKITPIHREMQKKMIRSSADLKIARLEQMEIMEVKDFDLDKAVSAVKKLAEMKTAQHIEILKSMKEVRSILTDEQFSKLKTMMHKDSKMIGAKPGPRKDKGMQHNHKGPEKP